MINCENVQNRKLVRNSPFSPRCKYCKERIPQKNLAQHHKKCTKRAINHNKQVYYEF